MLLQKYNSIMTKPEAHRSKWAFGLTVVLSAFIFVSFMFYRGFLSFGSNQTLVKKNSSSQTANVISATTVASPIQNTQKTLDAAFKEISKKYNEFTDSISSVFVPFITGIEVYERK
jgi:hypothetical protein